MLSKINHLLVFAFLIGLTSIAMTTSTLLNVNGVVTDAETGEPIPDVEVQIEELALSATTDEEGKFEFTDIQEAGIYTVVVEHDGYEKYEETHEIRDEAQTDYEMGQQEEDQQQNQDRGMEKDKGNKLEIELTPSNETGIEDK